LQFGISAMLIEFCNFDFERACSPPSRTSREGFWAFKQHTCHESYTVLNLVINVAPLNRTESLGNALHPKHPASRSKFRFTAVYNRLRTARGSRHSNTDRASTRFTVWRYVHPRESRGLSFGALLMDHTRPPHKVIEHQARKSKKI